MMLRPMRGDDVDAVESITAAAFAPFGDGFFPRSPVRAERFRQRVRHQLTTDPAGCWIAEAAGEVVGEAIALRRERMWILSSYAVLPTAQNRGIGKALLERALTYADGCVRGMIVSSPDQRAARRYRLAGFTLHPLMHVRGTVNRDALPFVDHVRPGTLADLSLLESVDRQVRGASHGGDHRVMAVDSALLVCDTFLGSGYAYVLDGSPVLLAATSRRVAHKLLWEVLARSMPAQDIDVRNITVENEWALDIGLAAGLSLETRGYLCLRGMRPPAPYVASGVYL
jgi:GNAT superfamily N-acetyltransferase